MDLLRTRVRVPADVYDCSFFSFSCLFVSNVLITEVEVSRISCGVCCLKFSIQCCVF